MKSRKTIGVCAVLIGLGMASICDAVIVGVDSGDGIPNTPGDYTNLTEVVLTAAGVTYHADLLVNTVGDVLTGAFNATGRYPEKRMTFSVDLEAGTYELYVRGCNTVNLGLSMGGGLDTDYGHNNTLYMFDELNADPEIIDSYLTMNTADATFPSNEVVWVNASDYGAIPDYTVSSNGTYSFSIIGREDGFLVDALAFVTEGQSVSFAELDTALGISTEAVGINSDAGVANTNTSWVSLSESTLTAAGVTYNSNLTANTFGTVLTAAANQFSADAVKRISFSTELPAGNYDLYMRGCNTMNLGLSMGGGLDTIHGHNNSLYVLNDLNSDPQTNVNYVQLNAVEATFPANEMLWVNLSSGYSAIPVYSAESNGTYSISLLPREDGFLVDAVAFVSSGHSITMAELDALLTPQIGSISIATPGSDAVISWSGQIGLSYALQYRENLTSGSWSNVVTNLVVTGDAVIVSNLIDTAESAFFRAVVE